MSQRYYPAESSSRGARRPFGRAATTPASAEPSEHAFSDSGYGGSISEDVRNFDLSELSELNEDLPMPPRITLPAPGADATDVDRRQHHMHVQQMHYNQNRVALSRSIYRTIDTLEGLQNMNQTWPIHYPAVQRTESSPMGRKTSMTDDFFTPDTSGPSPRERFAPPRRALTSFDRQPARGSRSGTPEPRLMSPQIAQEFNILKLDLRIGSLSQSELVHSLEKESIASLLDNKLTQAIKHLRSLRDRIEDTASKVLVTGDLNAGKSTFCNALLRKKILPEDQQPCTEIFCEVLDCRINNGVEEVHAIFKGATYDRNDERTYEARPLKDLEDIVIMVDKYSQAKIYVEDSRPIEQSLLRNGVVDIALIDAPGLNMDSVQTTAVFARQEEIDVVVFVVSAENHFTLSAKEFLWNAANEKAYLFIVVNRFDNIRDKVRCQRMILEQIANISPQTFNDSQDLVHFVSSNAVIDGKDPGKSHDFDNLENSLRGFVLDKRARSKLGPAKSYLLNLLQDIEQLALINNNVAGRELDALRSDLAQLMPKYDDSVKARIAVSEDCDRQIEDTCNTVYRNSRREISRTVDEVGTAHQIPWRGVFNSFQFAEETRRAMLESITKAVAEAENAARRSTVSGVGAINALGVMHLKQEYVERTFRPDFMFKKKKDALGRHIKTQLDAFDFFDFDRQEKVAGMSMSLTVLSVAGSRMFNISSWVDGVIQATNIVGIRNAKRLIIPAIIAGVGAAAYWIISDVQNAIPKKLAKKIKRELTEMDYVHQNSERISKEVRKVLRFPAEELRSGFQKNIEGLKIKKEEATKRKGECEVAVKYFGNLLRESREHAAVVRRYDLEAASNH
ncbi:mitofusin [Orbilia blumenaviensis]|uniref:Mitofusin n=1 Tax=Orbilia blumenaviensis TaxID=1796055 RepID=A0AAV9VMG2_9PEZI